jgi:predicted alpha/beta-fold hydrolase
MKRIGNRIYLGRLLRSLKDKLLEKIRRFPDKGITKDQVTGCDDFISYDDLYTAPAHGFENAVDYYSRCSSMQYLNDIRVPTLLISAQNDPFFTQKCIPYELSRSSDLLHLIAPRYGGHVGFTRGADIFQRSWMEEKMMDFILNQRT